MSGEVTLPPCGHTDRKQQLTEIEIRAETDQVLQLLACSVPGCPEYCRVFVDLRDPHEMLGAPLPDAAPGVGGPA